MKIAFLVSSVGDADLALQTIRALEAKPEPHEVVLVALSRVIQQQRVNDFQSPLLVDKKSLAEILQLGDDWPGTRCDAEQIQRITHYISEQQIDQVYIGVPSALTDEVALQVAEALNETPVLMAYEFMYKPEGHALWQYLPGLAVKPNLKWALPLATAKEDFPPDLKTGIIGHLSIDNAYAAQPTSVAKLNETRERLGIGDGQQLAFLSATTQHSAVDTEFLACLLAELPNHPGMQLRMGLHPGIKDMDSYMQAILAICEQHPEAVSRFRIILPDNLLTRFATPDLTISNPQFNSIFLRVNVSGAEATAAADRVAQAVPGALLNQTALQGKPAYCHSGKPYLPGQYFANSVASFFSALAKEAPQKADLNLDELTAAEGCAVLLKG